MQALHDYQAQQSDELSLVPGDVVNVLRKLSDGKKDFCLSFFRIKSFFSSSEFMQLSDILQ